MKLSKLCLWAIAGTVVLIIGTYVLAILLPFYQFEVRQFVIAEIYRLFYLCAAFGCAVALEKGRLPRLMSSGIAVGAIALVGWIAENIYNDYSVEWVWYTILIWPTNWASLMMIVGLLLLPEPRAKWWMQLRRITIGLFALLAAIICYAITFHPREGLLALTGIYDSEMWLLTGGYEEIASKLGYVIGLLACGGALFVWLAAAFIKPKQDMESIIEITEYWLSCPRCGLQQQAMTGLDKCDQCSLQIRVQLA